jgi:putative peptidoglycan lipid II flippase
LEISVKSLRQKIFSAAAIVGAFTILTQIGGFAKELTVAAWFGTGDALDAFLIALLVPTFAVNIIGGSLSASFVPTFIQVFKHQGSAAAQNILSNVIGWFILLCFSLSLLILVFAPQFLHALCSGFSIQKFDLTRLILYFLMPIILLKGLSNICSGVLNSLESFALPAALQIFGPLAAIILIGTAGASLGIYALVAGTLIGFGLEAALMGLTLIRRNFSLRPRIIRADPAMRTILAQFLPVVAGTIIMGSTEVIDKGMAAALAPGSVSSLNYGNKITAAVLTLATTALGTALLPYFSKMAVDREWKDIRSTIKLYIGLIFALGIPGACILFGISEAIVQLVFQRGSFTSQDTTVVASIQSLFALQIPFYVASIVVVRLISSLRANHILMWGAAINLVVNVTLNIVFIQFIGLKGIALSTSCVYLVSFVFLYYCTHNLIAREESLP